MSCVPQSGNSTFPSTRNISFTIMLENSAFKSLDREKIAYHHVGDDDLANHPKSNTKQIILYLFFEAIVLLSLFLSYILYSSRAIACTKESSGTACKLPRPVVVPVARDMERHSRVKERALSAMKR